jgi:DNA-binding XRE family transcriptional regulator
LIADGSVLYHLVTIHFLTTTSKPIFRKRFSCAMNKQKNQLKEIRESRMLSKAELARKANVSPITIGRIENGLPCRMETKRKILLALGFKLSDKDKIFQHH